MSRAVWAFAITGVLLAAGLTWVVLRGEDTRRDLKVVEKTVDPCAHPKSDACQRRIGLVLRELLRRHPDLFHVKRRPDTRHGTSRSLTDSVQDGGGGASGSPTGGGPVGRVPSPGGPPADQPPSSEPPAREPLIDLDAPLVPRTCVGDVVAVNC